MRTRRIIVLAVVIGAIFGITALLVYVQRKDDGMSFAQCEAMGGQIVADPGNGSVNECPAGTTDISGPNGVDGSIEAVFCCK